MTFLTCRRTRSRTRSEAINSHLFCVYTIDFELKPVILHAKKFLTLRMSQVLLILCQMNSFSVYTRHKCLQ